MLQQTFMLPTNNAVKKNFESSVDRKNKLFGNLKDAKAEIKRMCVHCEPHA